MYVTEKVYILIVGKEEFYFSSMQKAVEAAIALEEKEEVETDLGIDFIDIYVDEEVG